MIKFVNGTLVTGDGSTVLENTCITINGDRIASIGGPSEDPLFTGEVIDASNCVIMPGVINHHMHGVTMGPLHPSATDRLTREEALRHQHIHLCQGTTTVLSNDGFVTMDEIEEARKLSPLNIQPGTSHTPSCLRAAQAADGAGLLEHNIQMTADAMIMQ